MTHLLLAAPVVVLAAAINRHRGGWLGTGHTQWARADFAAGTAILWLLASWGDWRGALAVLPLTFLGCLAGQGYDQADDTPLKAAGLIGSGLLNFAGVGLASWWAALGHPDPLALVARAYASAWHLDIAGYLAIHFEVWNAFPLAWPLVALAKPLVYRLGKYLPGDWIPTLFGQGFARGSTEWGELLFGAVEGAGIVACAALHFIL